MALTFFPDTNPIPTQSLQKLALSWYNNNARQFPWRNTRNPFHILIAEVLLRQTQAERIAGPYLELISIYPNPETLVDADVDQLRSWFKPLGLVTRVEHLISASRQIKDLHNADGIEVKDFENPQPLIVTGIQGVPSARTTKTETKIANCGGSPFIVRLSAGALKEEMPGALPPISGQHAETDPMLRASGLPYNIIRAHFFMQNTMIAAQTTPSGLT